MIGFYGKLPLHGDFIRRQLPLDFVQSWDAWLQTCLPEVGQDITKPLCFHLPPGSCGALRMAGAMVPSRDAVGRHFPLTIAVALDQGEAAPERSWFRSMIQLAETARDEAWPADALVQEIGICAAPGGGSTSDIPEGWWLEGDGHLEQGSLLSPADLGALVGDRS